MRRRCPVGGRSRRLRGRCCSSRRISIRMRNRTASSIERHGTSMRTSSLSSAKRAAEAGQLSLAFEWATEAVRENPDHADARRVLGYELVDGQWLTPFAKRMVDAGKEWDPQRGWVATGDVQKEQKPTKNGWRVRTDHFLVTSNHSQAAAAELAARLERLHQVWRQLFAGFYYSERRSPATLCRRAASPRAASAVPRVLSPRQGRLRGDAPASPAADRRDAGHLFRRRPRGPLLRRRRSERGHAEPRGGPSVVPGDAARRPARRRRWPISGSSKASPRISRRSANIAIPRRVFITRSASRRPAGCRRPASGCWWSSSTCRSTSLTRLGKDDLQRYPELAKLYSQSAGLAALLMDGEAGRYREPLVEYLSAVYAGRDNADRFPTRPAAAWQTSTPRIAATWRACRRRAASGNLGWTRRSKWLRFSGEESSHDRLIGPRHTA